VRQYGDAIGDLSRRRIFLRPVAIALEKIIVVGQTRAMNSES
jgi:hypothetical protein